MNNEAFPVNTETKEAAPVQETRSIRNVQPLVDIQESPDGFTIVADVPGAEQQDVNLRIEKDVLHVEAIARTGGRVQAIKRPYEELKYTRAFNLGRHIDRDRVEAELKHGVLRVTLPKAAEAQPKQIDVRIAS